MRETSRRRLLAICCAVAILVLAGAASTWAQTGTSALTGTVLDNSNSVVPGATVTLTQTAVGLVRTTTSNSSGLFHFSALPPGAYSLTVTMQGFKPESLPAIALQSSDVLDVGNLMMQVGAQAESVTVESDSTPVQTESSERSATVTGQQLQDIQLKGRDVFGFTDLLPGVVDLNNARESTTWTSMSNININGLGNNNRNIVVDGINVIDEGANQNAFVNQNVDSVAEVRVLANSFQAEYGRNNGGTISMVTKGGSNDLHGSGWYAGRRTDFTANTFFNNEGGLVRPVYNINIDGFSIGGPVVIPKLYNGRKKLFFFGSEEYTNDQKAPVPVTANEPTALQLTGNFSSTFANNGTLLPILDPLTGKQFAGNIIPASRIDPVGLKMLQVLTPPNGYVNTTPGQLYTANFQSQNSPQHARRDDVVRIDKYFTEHTNMMLKWAHDKEQTINYDQVSPGAGAILNPVPGWVFSGHLSQTITPTVVNEITAGYGHNNFANYRPDGTSYTQYYASAVGFNAPLLVPFKTVSGTPAATGNQDQEWPYAPELTFAGGNGTANSYFYPGQVLNGGRVVPQFNQENLFSVEDGLTKVAGRHNLKAGVYVEYNKKTEPNLGSNYTGLYNFGSTTNNPLDTGFGYSNALLGVFQQFSQATARGNSDLASWQVESYVQDNWRVSRRLTVDIGVRFTHTGAFKELANANAEFFPSVYSAANAAVLYRPVCTTGVPGNQSCASANEKAMNPITGALLPFGYQGTAIPGLGNVADGMKTNGTNGQGTYFTYPFLVAVPRLGFAWDPFGDGKTSIRGAAGLFYNRPGKGGYGNAFGAAPVLFNQSVLYSNINQIPAFANDAVVSPLSGVVALGGQYALEYSKQVNFTIQREIGFKTVIEAAYVGNFDRPGLETYNLNTVPLYAYGNPANLINNTAINAAFLGSSYPGIGAVNQTRKNSVADALDYHGLQIQGQRRLSKGLQFGVAYTLSRADGLTGFDQYTEAGMIPGLTLHDRYYGPIAVDRKHVFAANYTYTLPIPKQTGWKKYFTNDWVLSGITKFQTGAPITPTCTTTTAGVSNQDPTLTGLTGATAARCELVGPVNEGAAGGDPARVPQFNTAAFQMAQVYSPTVGNFGNTPVGVLRQPSWTNWDMTLAKRIPVTIHGREAGIRVQIQAYNVFNHVEFTTMGSTYSFSGANSSVNTNTTTGLFTATNPPRQMALTVRFDY